MPEELETKIKEFVIKWTPPELFDGCDDNSQAFVSHLQVVVQAAMAEGGLRQGFEALHKSQESIVITKTTCIIDLGTLKKALGLPEDATIRVSECNGDDFELGESANIYAQWEVEEEQ